MSKKNINLIDIKKIFILINFNLKINIIIIILLNIIIIIIIINKIVKKFFSFFYVFILINIKYKRSLLSNKNIF